MKGFNNWRSALTDKSGFARHNGSIGHMNATARYIEKKKRMQSGTSISELVITTVLQKRRYLLQDNY